MPALEQVNVKLLPKGTLARWKACAALDRRSMSAFIVAAVEAACSKVEKRRPAHPPTIS